MPTTTNTVITIVLSLQTLFGCLTSTIGQFIYSYYLEVYLNSPNQTYTVTDRYDPTETFPNETNRCTENHNESDGNARLWAQQQSSDLFFWINLTSAVPLIVMTYILGLYSSKLGIRFLVVWALSGGAIQQTIWLSCIYFNISYVWWFIAAIIVGLSGSSSVLGFALNIIVTENTTERERSVYFVRLQATQTGLAAIVTFLIGYYIAWRGYHDLYWMALFIQITSIIIVIVYFKGHERSNVEERRSLLSTTTDETEILETRKCSQFFEVLAIFRPSRRSKEKNLSLIITVISSTVSTFTATCFASLLWLLLSAPFCWSSKGVGNYSAVSAVISAVLSILGMQALTYFGANDAIICFISQLFFGVSCLWTGLARHTWELYAGLLISGFSGYQDLLTTSMVSKWLQPHERSHAFTFLTEVKTIVTQLGNALFNWLYSRTAATHPASTYIMAAGFTIVPLALNMWLYIITRRMPNEEVPSVSQADIEPIPLQKPSDVPPHAGVNTCRIVPSRSLIAQLLAGTGEEGPVDEADETGYIANTSTDNSIL